MKRIRGGAPVRGGYYWNLSRWEVVAVGGEGGTLPGPEAETWVQVSLPALLVAGPAMGLAYVVLLPVIGLGMGAAAVARRLGLAGHGAVAEMAATMTPAWRPGEAHLAGKPNDKPNDKPAEQPAPSDALRALQDEVEQQRKGEKKD